MVTIKVAVVQSEPVYFDLKASVVKANNLIIDAYNGGAELVAFPEVFIPGYPAWLWTEAIDYKKNERYIKNCLEVDSPLFQSIVETVKSHPINVVLGFAERDNGSVYMAQCVLSKEGQVVMKRRKLKATHIERILFGDGGKQDLNSVADLEIQGTTVQVGALNCWEHTQPLLTFNSASRHEKIHVGAWPAMFASDSYSWSKEGTENLARAYAIQTQSFYLMSTSVVSPEIKEHVKGIEGLSPEQFRYGGGCSAVFGPDGSKLSTDLGDTVDGLLFAELDMDLIVASKHLVDVVGHYSRPDLLSLTLH